MNDDDPVLYILMRNDLESMNPGKAMAQAAHAANEFAAQKTSLQFDHDMDQEIFREYLHSMIHPGISNEEKFRRDITIFVDNFFDLYAKWAQCPKPHSRRGSFGTTVVLQGSIDQIEYAVINVRRNFMKVSTNPEECFFANLPIFDAQIIVDPTYPIKDGQVTHLIELPTCAYVFGRACDLREYVGDLELHR